MIEARLSLVSHQVGREYPQLAVEINRQLHRVISVWVPGYWPSRKCWRTIRWYATLRIGTLYRYALHAALDHTEDDCCFCDSRNKDYDYFGQ